MQNIQRTWYLLAVAQAATAAVVMQNMHKWTGGLSDEWAFLSKGGPRGPITKAVLAFFIDKGLLHHQTFIWHTSLDSSHGQELWVFVRDWKAESLEYQGVVHPSRTHHSAACRLSPQQACILITQICWVKITCGAQLLASARHLMFVSVFTTHLFMHMHAAAS